ncbi:MAG: Eco57I restriction-modification methylase domain-containing protein [Bacteroidales bacterium]|nr:Eco57I restriction-modification methylase domain-containing protein [Bacteroidales bacterium]
MKFITQSPKKALKAFLKQRPNESERDKFKANLIALLDKISVIEKQPKDESEEHLKNNLRDFLRDTFYIESNAINTKDKKDLVIYIGKSTDTDAAVIIEAKRPSNVKEMVSADNANKKALHELILYYLNERNQSNNIQLKQLVITNIYEWFIIDANQFDKHIYRNTQIKKLYETKLNDKKDNPWFYEEISKIISKIEDEIHCVYFDIRDYDRILRNNITEDDKELVALYKIISPQHLLKIASPNDSNTLNERFYKELLHIIGLEEAKEGTKNVIRRKKENRNVASLIELTVEALKTEDTFHRIPDIKIYGENKEEQTFNIALELCITWINRILFLKLLEGQLISYHQGNKDYRFLNSETIHDYDELFKLFHKVLAVNIPDRTEANKNKYSRVPYLNSSLFEISELEDQTIKINSLENDGELELINTTILKEIKKKADKLPSLNYLFNFLDAYDFSSEGAEDWQKDNKQLINASVLGKVFEKINGYRDGSIFTPAFITMYMCRQSIRLAVVEKFNEALSEKGKKLFDKFDDIKNYTSRHFKTEEVLKANEIINSLHICDPAVGSGHFLVSALNEIIAIKAELGILADDKGNNVSGYEIEIVNDELIITDQQGNIVEYKLQNGKPANKEMQRLQKTLFHQKETIIENCLFGVDINPKSVLICRLRLWIELLKNAYYKEAEYTELETLPNIDINIKCGNSLLSRFALDADLSKALKSIKYDIKAYRGFVNDYKSEKNREVKRGLQKIIDTIKSDFKTEIVKSGKDYQNWYKAKGELEVLTLQTKLFQKTPAEKKKWNEDVKALTEKIKKYEAILDEIKTNVIYKNAFEWRFEFPEIIDNKGNFEGFDLIIGNPPYIKEYENRDAFNGLRKLDCYQGKMDIWYLFGDLGLRLLKPNNHLCYIATNNWVTNAGASNFRNIVIKNSNIVNLIDFGAYMIFENASIQTMIMLFKNNTTTDNYTFDYRRLEGDKLVLQDVLNLLEGTETEKTNLLSPSIVKANLIDKPLTFNTDENSDLLDKIKTKHNFIIDPKKEIAQGIVPNPDVVNNNNILKLPAARVKNENIKVGDGVFILDKGYFSKLSAKEIKYIKPVYEPYLIDKYSINDYDKEIIYITKKNFKNDAPKLISHLEKFKEIMDDRRENQQGKLGFNHLHWPRDEYFFEKGEKILCVRKCAIPTFAFTEEEAYVMMSFNVIRSKRVNLKYLTGLLNSKLVAFWLRKKGKMQGNAYQLDKEPLLEIPIYKPADKEANEIAKLVDKIISLKQQGKDSSEQEKKIDELIYKLYDITIAEQKIIEGK